MRMKSLETIKGSNSLEVMVEEYRIRESILAGVDVELDTVDMPKSEYYGLKAYRMGLKKGMSSIKAMATRKGFKAEFREAIKSA